MSRPYSHLTIAAQALRARIEIARANGAPEVAQALQARLERAVRLAKAGYATEAYKAMQQAQ